MANGRPLPRGPVLVLSVLVALALAAAACPAGLAAPPLRNPGPASNRPAANRDQATTASRATGVGRPGDADQSAPERPESPARTGNDGAKPAPRTAAVDPGRRLRSVAPAPRTPADSAATVADPGDAPRVRFDDPVLRWLPEILDAHDRTGTPASIIAGVIRVESSGDPNAVSPAGARGLMQIMPEELTGRGLPAARWHDPWTNVMAGAVGLAERRSAAGSWEGAVARYFGIGCDVLGTCTGVYVDRVFDWAARYAPVLGDPFRANLRRLPTDWAPPAITPAVAAPRRVAAAPRPVRPARQRAVRVPRATAKPPLPETARPPKVAKNDPPPTPAPTAPPPIAAAPVEHPTGPPPTVSTPPPAEPPVASPPPTDPPTVEPPATPPRTIKRPNRSKRAVDDRPLRKRDRPRPQSR